MMKTAGWVYGVYEKMSKPVDLCEQIVVTLRDYNRRIHRSDG